MSGSDLDIVLSDRKAPTTASSKDADYTAYFRVFVPREFKNAISLFWVP